jgi:hypothetical protein
MRGIMNAYEQNKNLTMRREENIKIWNEQQQHFLCVCVEKNNNR